MKTILLTQKKKVLIDDVLTNQKAKKFATIISDIKTLLKEAKEVRDE